MTGRISNYLSFLAISMLVGIRQAPDVVICMTDPPIAYLVGLLIAKLRRKPFIYYIQDFHPDMALKAGLIKEGLSYRLWDLLHRFVLRNADKVVVIGENMKTRVASKGTPVDRVKIIRGATYHSKFCQL